jgi:Na+/H+-translocating membrane pyrophosphatase
MVKLKARGKKHEMQLDNEKDNSSDIEHLNDENNNLIKSDAVILTDIEIKEETVLKLEKVAKQISDGANIFLLTEYLYLLIFIAIFALLIFFVGEHKQWTAYTTIAFLVGALTSILCGFIGMKIATASNYRTTYSA